MDPTPIWPDSPKVARLGRARRRRIHSGWEIAAAALVAAFLIGQLVLIATIANGPTLDEGIYITAGRRTLEGYGFADNYLTWLSGSLLWPVIAGLGDAAAGLDGARALAAVFVTIGVAAMWRAALILFGPRAAFFSVALAVAAGPVIALGHLAVVDAPAVAGIAVAFWAVAELARSDHRGWLVLAAAAFSVGVLSKYPAAACGVPLVLLVVLLRGRRAPTDLALCGLLVSAVLLTYFLSARGPLGSFLDWRVENNPGFGVTRPMVAFSQLWYGGLPLVLALGGWLVCRRKALATVLLGAGALIPAYHLALGNSVSDTKHVVFGFIFTLPLAGRLLEGLARWPNGAFLACIVTLAAGAFGALQAERLDRSWMDVEPATRFLAERARPGETFLIDNAWPFTRRLYIEGKLRSPWSVYDVYRVQHGQTEMPICRLDWFVAAQGAGSWPRRIRRRIKACGSFRRVYRERSPVTGIGANMGLSTWVGKVEIYRNIDGRRAG
jgi:hypothetical protein